jgi:hypothetical protein
MKNRLVISPEGSGQLKIFEENYSKTVKSTKSKSPKK